jgi:hypothetical protein
MNATNLFWSTNGDGTFQNTRHDLMHFYFPDRGPEQRMVTHASRSNGTLPSVTDSMILSIFHALSPMPGLTRPFVTEALWP